MLKSYAPGLFIFIFLGYASAQTTKFKTRNFTSTVKQNPTTATSTLKTSSRSLSTTLGISSSTSTTHWTTASTHPARSCVFLFSPTKTKPVEYSPKRRDFQLCFPGVKSNGCDTWSITNMIVLKNEGNKKAKLNEIEKFVNVTSKQFGASVQSQWYFAKTDGFSCALYYYNFNYAVFRKALSAFEGNVAFTDNANPGNVLFKVLQNSVTCTLSSMEPKTGGAVFIIFTDLTIVDLCSSDSFMYGFTEMEKKLFNQNYLIKFVFLESVLSQKEIVEKLLPNCYYNNDKSYCEVIDSTRIDQYADNDDDGSKMSRTTEMILLISIPFVSITICCIGFFAFCLKRAKLRLESIKLKISNSAQFVEEEPVTKFRLRKITKISSMESFSNVRIKDEWEINPKNLLVQEENLLGNGAFANVFKGVLKGTVPLFTINQRITFNSDAESSGHHEVAIKKLRPHADEQNRKDFYQEIAFMKKLGFHPHIINMFGCISSYLDPMIIIEYCSRGDLLKFLRRHKEYVLLEKTDECPIQADICLRIKDLVSIAWQVSDGMAYMASKNFVHRDLAARNILLTKSLTAKISDFGLCRHFDADLYTSRGGRLPIKWMSIEALKHYEFTQKSDVWSFGVLLFEIFSMGDVPYATIQQVELLEHLQNGKRLPQPLKCPNEIYKMMENCWKEDASERPEFNEVRSELTMMLNLDDESYGYLNVESDVGAPKIASLTMLPQNSPTKKEPLRESSNVCQKLDQVMAEKFGEEQAVEIKKMFCDLFPEPAAVLVSSRKSADL